MSMVGSASQSVQAKSASLHDRIQWLITETAEDDWDTNGSPRIPREYWAKAEELACVVMDEIPWLTVPFPSPGDGYANLQWSDHSRREIDAEFRPDGIHWSQKVDGVRSRGKFSKPAELIEHLRRTFA